MKNKLTDDLRSIYTSARRWVLLELEYCKLTAAEKVSILTTALVTGAVALLFAAIILVLLSLCLVSVFNTLMPAWLAYLCVVGIYVLMLVAFYFLRKQLISNKVAKFITRLFMDPDPEKEEEKSKNNKK